MMKQFAAAVSLALAATVASAAPTLTTVSYTESGNNVSVTFVVKDLNPSAFSHLPIKLYMTLYEEDIIFDDFLGTVTTILTDTNATALSGGGFESLPITLTFINASDAFTGWGNDYLLKITAIPEPGTLALAGLGLAGLLRRRRLGV
jgi:uncharacterized protein (TIGR03382 family)